MARPLLKRRAVNTSAIAIPHTDVYAFGDLYFDGRWQPGAASTPLHVKSPWTGEPIGSIAAATPADVARAYEGAWRAQQAWAAAIPGFRARVFSDAARVMERRKAEIVEWLVRETGSTVTKAGIEWWAVHNSMSEAATLPSRVEGRILEGDYPAKENRIYRIPVGVVAVISPWNWPLHLSSRSILPALALGNAVVVKPSAETPITGGLLIAKILEEAGLPPGVFSVIVGRSAEIGDPFVQHAIPRVVSFTGSTAVGRHIGKLALESPLIKRTMLELGGNAPLVVTDDVDLERAARTAIVGKFLHQGQLCIAVNRIIVADAIHDAFVDRFVALARALPGGSPRDTGTVVGPLINSEQLEKIARLVAQAQDEGARLRLGEAVSGLVMPPRVLDGVRADMAIAREEIFGPVAPILRASNDDEAIRLANDTDYGLTSAVLCRDLGRAALIARRIEAGMTHINDIPAIDMPQMPFGGEKNSGLGRFGSRDVVEAFTTQHWISVQHVDQPLPF
jgi:aldehyde dehydrogenase (NAD+)